MRDMRNLLLGDAKRVLKDEIRIRQDHIKTMKMSASNFWEDQKAIMVYAQETTVLEETIAQLEKAAAIR